MVGENNSTNVNHKIYKTTVRAISRGREYCDTKFVALFDHFVDMYHSFKTQMEIGINKISNLWVQTIDMSDKAVLT